MKAGRLSKVIRTALSEGLEKTDSKIDEIAEREKEKRKEEELQRKLEKMRERDPFIYD